MMGFRVIVSQISEVDSEARCNEAADELFLHLVGNCYHGFFDRIAYLTRMWRVYWDECPTANGGEHFLQWLKERDING